MTETSAWIGKAVFWILLVVAAFPFVGTAAALVAGILFSVVIGNPWPKQTAAWSKRVLQLSVVGLGFGVHAVAVWQEARTAVIATPVGIILVLALGRILGRMLATNPNTSDLVSFGTAICGGSAIAAMAPVLKATDDETAVSLATVFSLNAVALLLFPPLGHLAGLSERQFGLWAALAIHDTSSVVGASAAFGGAALAVGTTVKLARAIWISPFALAAAWFKNSKGKPAFPWFILGFIGAALLRAAAPQWTPFWEGVSAVAKQGLVVTLFLVGNGMTLDLLRKTGTRPLAQGVILWLMVSCGSLAAIVMGWIA